MKRVAIILTAVAGFLAMVGASPAASPPGDVVGRVTVGYQGWFACVGDGAPINSWWHWSGTFQPPTATTLTNKIQCWPDMRQYAKGYATALANFGNGQPATLFSSYDDQTVRTHFRWLAENGIDTAALQRFSPFGGEGPTRNDMTVKVRNAAEMYNRKFYIMYDITGWTSFSTEIKNDWTNTIVGLLHATSSSAYARQNGKPVVCIWGMGFTDRPGDAPTCLDVINWFKAQGCYVIGGVPTHWRDQNSDSKPAFISVYNDFDMISPWMVGRIGDVAGADSFKTGINFPDVTYCNSHGIDYQPCILPGGNNQRAHGDLMWRQFFNMMQVGAQAIYISMFDEYNEGNQIACTAEDASMSPTGSSALYFTLDQDGTHCSSDYYLRLTGDGGRMLKGALALTATRPTVPMFPVGLPPMPTNLTASVSNTQVTLAWNTAAGATSYNVKRASVSGGSYATLATNVGVLSYTDSGLASNASYYYVVSAVNGLGEGTNSVEAIASLAAGVASASADYPPTETAAMAFDGSTGTKWFDNNSPTGWLGYYFGGPAKIVVAYAVSSANDVPARDPKSWQFQGAHDGSNWVTLDTRTGESFATRFLTKRYATTNTTAYEYYRLNITANNGDLNNVQVSEFAFTFFGQAPPGAPGGFTAQAVSSSQINLQWAASPAATSYNIKRATAFAGPFTYIATGINSTNYNDDGKYLGAGATVVGLAASTPYYYVVSAVSVSGESSNSTVATAATPALAVPPAPDGLTATAASNQVNLVWNPAARATAYNVKRATLIGGPYVAITNGLAATSYADTSPAAGTAYYYAVSGTNAAGEGPDSAPIASALQVNLALNRPVVVSSVADSTSAASAVDGNLSTRWSSAHSEPQWIYVDLGANYSISRVRLTWESAYGKSYQVQVSSNASSWVTIYSTANGAGGIDDLKGLAGTGRYVRMYGLQRGTAFGFSLYELEIFGTQGTTTPSLTPPHLDSVVSNSLMQFNWPQDHLGWHLEVQTNPTSSGLGMNWFTVPGTSQTNQVSLPINATNGSVFYRLAWP